MGWFVIEAIDQSCNMPYSAKQKFMIIAEWL